MPRHDLHARGLLVHSLIEVQAHSRADDRRHELRERVTREQSPQRRLGAREPRGERDLTGVRDPRVLVRKVVELLLPGVLAGVEYGLGGVEDRGGDRLGHDDKARPSVLVDCRRDFHHRHSENGGVGE